jgi:hypothetical protein
MMGPPKSFDEYMKRVVSVTWLAAGVMIVLMVAAIAVVLIGGRDPVRGFKPVSGSDRWITPAVAGLAIVITLVVAPLKTRTASVLRRRGQRASARVVNVAQFAKAGQQPITVEYTVEGRPYTLKRDMLESDVEQFAEAGEAVVLYDPKKPARAMILSPAMARL